MKDSIRGFYTTPPDLFIARDALKRRFGASAAVDPIILQRIAWKPLLVSHPAPRKGQDRFSRKTVFAKKSLILFQLQLGEEGDAATQQSMSFKIQPPRPRINPNDISRINKIAHGDKDIAEAIQETLAKRKKSAAVLTLDVRNRPQQVV